MKWGPGPDRRSSTSNGRGDGHGTSADGMDGVSSSSYSWRTITIRWARSRDYYAQSDDPIGTKGVGRDDEQTLAVARVTPEPRLSPSVRSFVLLERYPPRHLKRISISVRSRPHSRARHAAVASNGERDGDE